MDTGGTISFESDQELYDWLRENSPGTIILQSMEEALVGVMPQTPGLYALCYEYEAVLEVLRRDLQIDYAESVVYFTKHLWPLYEKYKNPMYIRALEADK
jgi:hypothetical protein